MWKTWQIFVESQQEQGIEVAGSLFCVFFRDSNLWFEQLRMLTTVYVAVRRIQPAE